MNEYYEKHLVPQDIAVMFGVSAEYVRAACNRGKDDHPLPHINTGTKKRQHLRIRPSVFAKWLDDEEWLAS
jgi:hypothetical protein